MSLSALAIRRPVTTAMFFTALGVLGLISLQRLSIELMPEVVYPEIYVSLSGRAASPEQVERDLVIPVEEELGRLAGVASISSQSSAGRGTVRVSYRPGTAMKFALLQAQSRVDRVLPSLPAQTRATVQRFDSGNLSAAVMELQVLGEGDLNRLRDFAEQKIQPELEAVDGVVSAAVLGGQPAAVEVIVDPLALEAHGLTLNQLGSALNAANRPRTYLGQVYGAGLVYPVSAAGQFADLRQAGQTLLRPGQSLRLEDIATVRRGVQTRTDLSRVNGQPAVGIRIQKEDDANLIAVARGVAAEVARLNRELAPEGVSLLVTASQADLMEQALHTLVRSAVVGLLLGLGVLFLFLRNLRFVAVLALAVPASLLITFNLMYAGHLSLNVLSLCGLALAMGMLTDNSIVVMESVFKHAERGKAPAVAARDGTAEVSRAVVASTATTVLVFLPVVFIQSDYQDALRQLALAVVFPLLASLAVALTLVPSVAARTLARGAPAARPTGRLMSAYTVLLKAGLRHRGRLGIAVAVVLLGTLVTSAFLMLQQEVVPEESQFAVYADLPEGSTLEATDAVVAQVEDAVRQLPGVERFAASVRQGQGTVTVQLEPRAQRPDRVSVETLKQQLSERTATIPGGSIGYESLAGGGGRGGGGGGAAGRATSAGSFSSRAGPTSEQIVVRGYDFATLQMIADDVVFRLQETDEVDAASVRSDVQRSAPEVQVIPDPLAMLDRSLDVRTVLAAVQDAVPEGFQTQTRFLQPDGTEVPIEVRTTEDPEAPGPGLAGLRQLPVPVGGGRFAALQEVAAVRTDEGRGTIQRTDQSRRVVVSYRFASEVLDSQPRLEAARQRVRQTAADLVLPEGYTAAVVEAETDTTYYWMMGVAAVLVYMVLAGLFESLGSPVIIFATLPTAAIGSCWALLLSGTGLTSTAGPMALLGFIVLIGIAVNNGIILIDAIGVLRARYGFRRERAVLVASRTRVRPILMTSATTLLGVLPLALQFGGDYEVWPPFALTVLGGLSVSMLSTLLLVPAAYMGIGQVSDWLRRLGVPGLVLAALATAAGTWAVQARFERPFWTALAAVPLALAALGAVWTAERVHRARAAQRRFAQPVQAIQLRTLTKAYGAPGRLRREWGRFERRAALRRRTGRDPVDRGAVADSLLWKLPLLGLVAYLHAYFEDPAYLYLLALATWYLLGHLIDCAAVVAGGSRAAPVARLGQRAARLGLPLLFLSYVQWRLGLPSVTAASAAAWLALAATRGLADRVRDGRVDPEALAGRAAWVRRRAYAGAAALPLVGVARPPFTALDGVDLEIGRGMFGLLGPNGAGKTTLMRIVSQVLEPTSGSVAINGTNVRRYGRLQGLVGYLPQHFGLYDHLTVYQYLEYRALLEGFRAPAERRERVLACLGQVHLDDRCDDPIGALSGGMRQRVGIAQTLLHMPQILVVDEPTAGLDPVERIRFRNLLARVSQQRIVLFSTHIVEDVAGSCNRLAVLERGRLLYTGTPDALRDGARGRVWEAVVPEAATGRLDGAVRIIAQQRTALGVRTRFLASAPPLELAPAPAEPTLEDAYIDLLERAKGMPC
ncbi:MAG: efflux RND transporter permease subunit [Gemmatimonadota bacterium]